MNELSAISLTIFATVIGAFGSLYLKKGSANLHRTILKNFFKIIFNRELLFGIFLFLFSSVFYVWALKYARLSLVYPITSFSYIWVSLLSVKFLDENMNKYKWFGIILIITGVFLITR
ncbi:MAG: EamA family transporter [Nanoarchaeota archaeon]|nr:EamA family transporter [Nanoarchaeota archaeon]MBU1270135.1 EamA family transporter [Nanoarchaeota archaeon]MBU1604459.1 EamA family transporter [Nanoarchaeota archaeon]MBU2443468.1 EamA family transporter [Nanoarchaeota archaeon]